MNATLPVEFRAVLAEHYACGMDVTVEQLQEAHGSTNEVVVIRIRRPRRPPTDVVVRRRDTSAPQYEGSPHLTGVS